MIIKEKAIRTLEFDKIKELLASVCPTSGSAETARELYPFDDEEKIRKKQKLTTDAKRLLGVKGMPPFGAARPMREICARADKGALLTTGELLSCADILRVTRQMKDYIRQNKTFDTSLDEIFNRLIPHRVTEDNIFRCILSEDEIADDASPALADIRRNIRIANSRIKEILNKFMTGVSSKYLQESIVTIRNGRYVIPVKAENKNEIKGIIHDTSSSGATVFIEPSGVVDANNELRILETKEKQEIERIIATLSAEVADISEILIFNYENITEIAFYFGCAALSEKMNAVEPGITEERKINLIKARHPLIAPDKVVPINISLGGEYDTLIITGPNTGGKTVALKTLGLFALMAQAGLHVPAEDGSSVCVFEKILIDLGDEQSIAQSLSTFSSHMVNIVEIVEEKNDKALVLFDELGAGTDPVEGASLAVSIIEEIRGAGALCAATTHYAELKAFTLETPGVMNASCEFDIETLRPTYRLIIGTPGKSCAFAISEKLGLPERIIKRAGMMLSSETKRFEKVICELEATRLELEKLKEETEKSRAEFEKYRVEAEAKAKRELAAAERELNRAKEKAAAIVESARASSEFVFAQLDKVRQKQESERFGEELAEARRAVREHLRENEGKYNPVDRKKPDENYVLPRPLRMGDEVEIVSLGKRATVLGLPDRNGKVEVIAGIIKTKADISDLVLITDEAQGGKDNRKSQDVRITAARDFRSEIDLRGLTGDEAWLKVDKYFDEAYLCGFSVVRLIHGKGTGALRNALWRFLKGDPRVKSFRLGQYGEGDGGVTVVELK